MANLTGSILRWCFEMECSSAICIRALTPAIRQLHRVKIWWTFVQ